MTRTYTAFSRDVLKALPTILLENPAAIEHLPHAEAEALDRLFEANGLESSLFDLARTHGVESVVSPARLSAWRMARLMAVARATAFQDALDEIVETACGLGIPLRMLPATQMAFEVYAKPEMRPLTSLDVLVGGDREQELQAALRKRRFFELDDLSPTSHDRRHLRPLERDGVIVKLFRRSLPDDRPAPWETSLEEKLQGPIQGLEPEALIVLLSDEIARRKYAHSLRLFRDLHEAVHRLHPEWSNVVQLALESDRALEVFVPLALLAELLGTSVSEDAQGELEGRIAASKPERKLLLKVARATVLSTPAPRRHIEILTRILRQSPRESALAS